MSTSAPRTAQPRGAAFRAALVLATAGTVMAGCGRATEPVASHRAAAPTAGAATPPGDKPPTAAGRSEGPAVSPGHEAEASPVDEPTALAPLAAPATLTPEDLESIDRLLADLGTELTTAGHDAAIPEGDVG